MELCRRVELLGHILRGLEGLLSLNDKMLAPGAMYLLTTEISKRTPLFSVDPSEANNLVAR